MVTGAAPLLERIHHDIARRFGPQRIDQLLAMLDALERSLASPPAQSRPVENRIRRKAPVSVE
jgi:hypothetical protein